MTKQKFYAVRIGRQPGVYDSWKETQEQTDKFPGAVFKSFDNIVDAENFAFPDISEIDGGECTTFATHVYTDGSFIDGIAGWGYVLLQNDVITMQDCGYLRSHSGMRNIAGEIEAVRQAVTKAHEMGIKELAVYHDYEGLGRWADGDWQANRRGTQAYQQFIAQKRESGMRIVFRKIKGHSDDKYNDMADRLAARGVSMAK